MNAEPDVQDLVNKHRNLLNAKHPAALLLGFFRDWEQLLIVIDDVSAPRAIICGMFAE
jgi:hypothetical protein